MTSDVLEYSALDVFIGPFWSLSDVITLNFVVWKRDV